MKAFLTSCSVCGECFLYVLEDMVIVLLCVGPGTKKHTHTNIHTLKYNCSAPHKRSFVFVCGTIEISFVVVLCVEAAVEMYANILVRIGAHIYTQTHT